MKISEPLEYLEKNKDFCHLGWQLKQAYKNEIKTRVILTGHVLCLQIKMVDKGPIKYDWVNHKEFVPLQSIPGDKSEPKKTRVGLTPTPQLTLKDQAFVIFSDLAPNPSGDKSVLSQFKEDYIITGHRADITEMIDSADKGDRRRIIVKLPTRLLCLEFKKMYMEKAFNGVNPTIELPEVSNE